MSLKEKIIQLKNKIAAIFFALKRPDTPKLAKVVAAITVGYALSPIDLIPDFIPVLGYLDDIIILPLLIALCVKLIPTHIMLVCEQQAKEAWAAEGKQKKWQYALPIVAIWVLLIGVLILKIWI